MVHSVADPPVQGLDPRVLEQRFPLAEGFAKKRLSHADSGMLFTGWSPAHFKKELYRIAPICEWLPAYRWKADTAKDVSGAITLGCILVAQSLAHADLCKVDLINGPYSCIVPPILYSVFGTCVHSSVGTGGLVSLLTGEQMMKYGNLEDRTRAVGIFTLLVGLIIFCMGVFRLSFLVRFLSRPALSGFITASAVLIMVSQLKPMVGLPRSDAGGLLDILKHHPGELAEYSAGTLLLSSFSLLFLFRIKTWASCGIVFKFLGDYKELVLLVFTALLATQVHDTWRIDVVGNVPSGLPGASWPLSTASDLELAREMLPGAILVALVTFLSSFAGAKKFALQAGYQVVALNELLALGVANIGGAFFGAVPTQIGLSRMGIAYSAGVQSQLGANIYVAFIVAAVLQLFSTRLHFVPRCVLNAIIVCGASHLTEFHHMFWLWSLRSTRTRQRTYVVDFFVWWIALFATLCFGALNGILWAVGVSLALILYQVADMPISTLGWAEEHNRWLNMKQHAEARRRECILVFRPEGPLFYANVEHLQEWLQVKEIEADGQGQPLQALILSASAMPFIDTTALDALKQMAADYLKRNVVFMVANAVGQPRTILKHVLGDALPPGSLQDSWSVQECIAYFLQPAEASPVARAEALASEVCASIPVVAVVEVPPPAEPLLANLQTSLLRPRHGMSSSMPVSSSMPDLASMGANSRRRVGSELSDKTPRPLQRVSSWIARDFSMEPMPRSRASTAGGEGETPSRVSTEGGTTARAASAHLAV